MRPKRRGSPPISSVDDAAAQISAPLIATGRERLKRSMQAMRAMGTSAQPRPLVFAEMRAANERLQGRTDGRHVRSLVRRRREQRRIAATVSTPTAFRSSRRSSRRRAATSRASTGACRRSPRLPKASATSRWRRHCPAGLDREVRAHPASYPLVLPAKTRRMSIPLPHPCRRGGRPAKRLIAFAQHRPQGAFCMRHYEVVFIVHPDQSEQVPAMIERYRTSITGKNGRIHRLEDWGAASSPIRSPRFTRRTTC
jgi:hypothetical protein